MKHGEFLEPCEKAFNVHQESPYGDMWKKMSYHELASVAAYKARRATLLEPENPKIDDDIEDAINFLVFAWLQRRIKDDGADTATGAKGLCLHVPMSDTLSFP